MFTLVPPVTVQLPPWSMASETSTVTASQSFGFLTVIVPEAAVVVPGTRPVTTGTGRDFGIAIATPVIVKYRDERTSARTALEQWIR